MTAQQNKGRIRRMGCLCTVIVLTLLCGLAVSRCHRDADERTPAETTAVLTESVTTLPETTEPTTEPPVDESWKLRLVNSTHKIPADFDITLTELDNGVSVDSRIYPELQEMFDTMRAQGVYPYVREGFRTREYQISMMEERVNANLAQGYSQEEAESMARDYVAEPGTSEHELGLAVDINAAGGSDAWDVYTWLAEHAHEYGFILRYPEGKTEITGIAYEPWHYRYVGKEAAEEIHDQDITLEEYLGETS